MAYEPPSKTPVFSIKHKGECDLNGLVRAIRGWLLEHYFQFFETKHKYKPDEREIKFYGDLKYNEYVRYRIDFWVMAQDLTTKEVIRKGKTHTVEEGRIQIEFRGEMMLDYQKQFSKRKWLRVLQDFYHRYILRTTIEERWMGVLERHMAGLHQLIRGKLGMEAT